jgi:hypothetical protein
MYDFARESAWTRFWHAPLRAERLALTRILFGLALLADQLVQYLPDLADNFGPDGIAYAGLYDWFGLSRWRLTVLIFNTDDLAFVSVALGLWMAASLAFTLGWHTRWTSILVWFVTMAWVNRNPGIKNGGEDVLCAGLFLLMLSPCGQALSLDRLRERRKHRAGPDPPLGPAWPVRLIQIQLCILYLSTGLAKLVRALPGLDEDWTDPGNWGTWWQGTSIYYVLHNVGRTRWAYAQFPIPFWITVVANYLTVGFETFFPLLVLYRRTRKWTLWFGVLFHLGIYLSLEVGWFSFYVLCLYGVWVPDAFWDRWARSKKVSPAGASAAGRRSDLATTELTPGRR